jgi:ABC-type antimicrobial peptide transport system permease subunit
MGVLNTVLMSVLERTRELGVLMAIGMRKRKIALMVLAEGMFLGIIGTIGGLLLGFIPSYYTVVHGLDFTAWMGESFETNGIAMSAIIHGGWNAPRVGTYALGAVIFTILAALYPAWRVTRLQPVDAMRAH